MSYATSTFAAEIIAHRGASYDAPENTLASLELGFRQGADAGELDIHLTSDGSIAVLHDADTARISGVTNVVAKTTLSALRALEIGQWGKWKGSRFKERIPTLDEALALIPKGRRMFVEIKAGPEVLPVLKQSFERANSKPAQLVIIGFGYDTVKQAKVLLPAHQVFWLVGADKNKQYPPVSELVHKAREAGLDGLNLERGFPIDRAFVDLVHGAGLKLYTWTVDDPAVARRLAAAGVDGITTNRPEWLRAQLDGLLAPATTLFQDDFTNGPDASWAWIRENRSAWKHSPLGLQVKVEPGNMWGGQNNARNLLVREAPTAAKGALQVAVSLENSPTRQYEQANLVWYYDDSNMVKLGLELVDGQLSIVMGREEQDKTRTVAIIPVASTAIRVRFTVRGQEILGEYQETIASAWRVAGRCELPEPRGKKARISLQFYQGDPGQDHWARASGFQILDLP